jgi:indole-3-glycerol phosphate synthase
MALVGTSLMQQAEPAAALRELLQAGREAAR